MKFGGIDLHHFYQKKMLLQWKWINEFVEMQRVPRELWETLSQIKTKINFVILKLKLTKPTFLENHLCQPIKK
jgi:hypothetical protein